MAVASLLRLLKKIIIGPIDWFLYTVLREEHRKFLTNLLSDRQKNFLKRITKYGKIHQQKQQIQTIKYYLYNLGLIDRGLAELISLFETTKDASFKRALAWELALWHVNQYTEQDAQRALTYIEAAKENETNVEQLRKMAIIAAECYERIHQPEKAMQVIQDALEQEQHPDLYLAAANLETSIDKRVARINQVYQEYGLYPITFSTTSNKASYDDLQTKQIEKTITTGPKVSVILPAYNAADGIRIAIESILTQTWQNIELLVVDDCSTDNTIEVVKDYMAKDDRIKLLSTPENSGPYVARNIGLQEATGEFVTINDSDDWSHAEKIAVQVQHLIDHPTIIANTSEHARLTEKLKIYRRGTPGIYIFTNMSSLMFRREPVMKRLGFWDSVRFAADGEFIRRLRRVFGPQSIVNLKTGPLSLPRQSVNSLTGSSAFGYNGFFMGARREYVESLEFYHERAEDLYFPYPMEQRLFPAPEPMLPQREHSPKRHRLVDIVIVADFRTILDDYPSFLQEIAVLKQKYTIGFVQMSKFSLTLPAVINPAIRELINGKQIQMLVYGENIATKHLFVLDHLVLTDKQTYMPTLRTEQLSVRVKEIPHDNPNFFNKILSHLDAYFGQTGVWYPSNDEVQAVFKQMKRDLPVKTDKWENMMRYVK